MALIGFEGFDEMATADVTTVEGYTGSLNSLPSAVTNMGMPEGLCARLDNGGSFVITEAASADWVVGFHFNPRQNNTAGTLLGLWEGGTGGTEHMRLVMNADQTITISRAGSIPATSSPVASIQNGRTVFIEVYYKCHDTTGAWEVRVDGTAVIGPTGSLDTRNGGTAGTPNAIRFGTGAALSYYLDNVYWATGSTFLDEGRVVTDLPTSDGNYTAWTASAGSDFQCVDDATPNGDTDYISSATAAQRDSFGMATFGVTGTIRGVVVGLFGRKDDAGARTVQASVRKVASSTDYDGATKTLATTQAGYRTIWTTDPSTGVAWVDSDIDGFECGVENQ